MKMPPSMQKLLTSFKRFPGVGEKTAMRYVLNLCQATPKEQEYFLEGLIGISTLQRCLDCGLFVEDTGSETPLCHICLDPVRQAEGIICVVETVSNVFTLESAGGVYRGTYHVLNGLLNPLLKIGPKNLTIDKLLTRISKGPVKELILALSPSIEGDVTGSYIKEQVLLLAAGAQNEQRQQEIKVKKIGQGIPMGVGLEHLDSMTLHKAIEYRRSV